MQRELLVPYLNSSAIRRAEYNAITRTLTLWFTSGRDPYEYYSVPEPVYKGLLSAGSAGAYFNDYIKDVYSSNR